MNKEPSDISGGDFYGEIMGKVLKGVPSTADRWNRSKAAEERAVDAVKEGVRAACEISVALSSSEEEARGHIMQAERQLISEDRTAMGLHLAARLADIDDKVSKHEKNGWANTPPDARKFIQGSLGELCGKLDDAVGDPVLREERPELRKLLFPSVAGAEYRRETARGQLVYSGPKNVSDQMASACAKARMDERGEKSQLRHTGAEPAGAGDFSIPSVEDLLTKCMPTSPAGEKLGHPSSLHRGTGRGAEASGRETKHSPAVGDI